MGNIITESVKLHQFVFRSSQVRTMNPWVNEVNKVSKDSISLFVKIIVIIIQIAQIHSAVLRSKKTAKGKHLAWC